MQTKSQPVQLTEEAVADHIASLEPQAMEQLAPYWRTADILPAYPASTETVSELMDANGYRCDRDTIVRMMAEKSVPTPERLAGQLRWRAIDIKMLINACEARRRWKLNSPEHNFKFTQWERMQAIAEATGGKSCFTDLLFHDLSGLVCLLHEPGMENIGARQALAAALTEKLRAIGVDI